jgi:dienelactone hydrolase
LEKIGGTDCYIAVPSIDYPKDAVILVLPDVFGIGLVNTKLMVDDFARNGFKTVAVDLFNGDPAPVGVLTGDAPGFNLDEWLKTHGPETARPGLDAVYNALVEQGITRFAATGYCYGARPVFDLAFEGKIKTAAVSHPSLLTLPDDFEKYKSVSKAPLLINSCEVDSRFPIEAQAQADELMAGFAPGYKRTYWDGCSHGFATRSDLSDPKAKAGKEGAFEATVLWFFEHL